MWSGQPWGSRLGWLGFFRAKSAFNPGWRQRFGLAKKAESMHFVATIQPFSLSLSLFSPAIHLARPVSCGTFIAHTASKNKAMLQKNSLRLLQVRWRSVFCPSGCASVLECCQQTGKFPARLQRRKRKQQLVCVQHVAGWEETKQKAGQMWHLMERDYATEVNSFTECGIIVKHNFKWVKYISWVLKKYLENWRAA